MSKLQLKATVITPDKAHFGEKLTLKPTGLKGRLKCFTGEQGEFWVSIIPSLNVSGYGKTIEESKKSLRENIETLCEDLFAIDEVQRHVELAKLGWVHDKFFKKRYSKAYIDENGVLQDFDFPEKVEKVLIEAA